MKNIVLLSVGLCLATIRLAQADETLATLKVGDHVYKNVTVMRVTATDILFTSPEGVGNAKLKNLDPDLQKHFHYNFDVAAAAEERQKEDTARYHQAVLQGKPAPVPEDARAAAREAADAWGTDIAAALNRARSENKKVLLDFTGSDWCPWCIKFDEEVLKQSAFMDYATKNLILVRLDFPRHTPLKPELQAANDAASKRYKVDGFPTYILLNFDGQELGRQVGYKDGGPAGFTSELDSFAAAR